MTPSDVAMPSGAERVIELLRDEGVDRVFGNPGSTELAFVDALVRCDDIDYVLGLHEGCVVPMADGYAQATGRPAFVNLHTVSGLGNAIGVLANAKANGTPLVVTAGQQDVALLPHGPLLGYDLVSMARPVVKWAAEVRSEAELGVMLRRAFLDAAAAPAGPVFLSLPHDIMHGAAPTALPARSRLLPAGIAAGTGEIADLLAAARTPLVIVGQELATEAGSRAVIRLAEKLGAPLYGAFNNQRGVVPPGHPLWRGDMPAMAAAIATTLAPHDCILYAGGQAFQLFGGPAGPLLPPESKLIHIAPDPSQLGRSVAATIGAFGDLASTLDAIADHLPDRAAPLPAVPSPPADPQSLRFDALAACRILLEAMPDDAILHHELPTVGHAMRSLFRWRSTDQFFSSKQTIGWAMGAAVGVSLGHDRARRSIAIVGDGSAAFSLPALWSAAQQKVPVIFAIVDNRGYEILEMMTRMMTGQRANRSPAFDIGEPALDFAGIARGFGVHGTVVSDADGLREEIGRALASTGPTLIHVKVEA